MSSILFICAKYYGHSSEVNNYPCPFKIRTSGSTIFGGFVICLGEFVILQALVDHCLKIVVNASHIFS